MTARRWWWRVAVGVLAFATVELVVAVIDARADELRLALVVALGVGGVSLLLDAAGAVPARWSAYVEPEGRLSRLDPRTASYLRVVETHRSAREPDPALRGRLRELSDRTLRARHDLGVADPGAGVLLGPELQAVLTGPVRRLSLDEIERCVERIEQL